jgi:hypothetical protein
MKMVNEQNLNAILDTAIDAGLKAHEAARPTPMTVTGANQHYFVPEGACGFAWVKVHGIKGNTRIGKMLKARGFTKSYTGGLQYWISTMTQSVARKEAYAEAMASVLRSNGLEAYADSRLD